MPEPLTPGVYIEESTSGPGPVEAVATATCGIVGATQFGPVPYLIGDTRVVPGPTLVTSTVEFESLFGGARIDGRPCQLALAARGFFANGGRRLYVQRVFGFTLTVGTDPSIDIERNFATLGLPVGAAAPVLELRSRWPGSLGARIQVSVTVRRSRNILIDGQLIDVAPGAAVETTPLINGAPPSIADTTTPVKTNIRTVASDENGILGYDDGDGGVAAVDATEAAFHLTLDVEVKLGSDRIDVYRDTELGDAHPRSISMILAPDAPSEQGSLVWLCDPGHGTSAATPGELLEALLTIPASGCSLTGGGDGEALTVQDLQGRAADPESMLNAATGLEALGDVDEIALVAMPDTVDLPVRAQPAAIEAVIEHCRSRYRFAMVDPPRNSSIAEVRDFRAHFDTSHAALYYPWLRIVDPTRETVRSRAPKMLDVPPSGYIAGSYARNDLEHGVHKAPANLEISGITGLVTHVTRAEQESLNPEGVNVLRFFEGQGYRVWGARTMSSDPEWRYVAVRRLLNYLQHSISTSTQWAVFESNDERLWSAVRQSVDNFLTGLWRTGALQGSRTEDAFFVRCDRTTMTQNDLDSGRLICLCGVAVLFPAEFVIFRIEHRTLSAADN